MRLFALASFLALSLGAATTSIAAPAGYTTLGYGGTVSVVRAATSGPAGPADIQVGTPVSFSATFDPSRAVDISQTVVAIDRLTGLPVPLPGLTAVSLFDDPNASYAISVGSHVFTSADDDLGGADFGLGAGHFPLLIFNDGQLLGIDGEAVVDGLAIDVDPLAKMLHYQAHVGNGYFEADGDYALAIDTSLDPLIAAAPLAAVPEPSTWALMLAGIGLVGHLVRRERAAHSLPAAMLGAASLALTGCAAASMASATPAATVVKNCESNANYAMTGVVYASTKRELDNCRRGV